MTAGVKARKARTQAVSPSRNKAPLDVGVDGSFARRLVDWQKRHGRQTLPWQQTRDPYRIWLSEIMLQQTQVATVIPYYQRFLQRFPDVASLARAELEEVLALWSGLGYYSRARNLHQAARQVAELGEFPSTREGLEQLSGVGRSTAAAIAVFSRGANEAILDGNVKRVLSRHFAIEGFPGASAVEKRLWQLAEALLPAKEMEAYTQGLMDLGATLCTRARPACDRCPVGASCLARRDNRVAEFPAARLRKPVPHKTTVMAILLGAGEVYLEQRPPTGIWGGMLSFPEFSSAHEAVDACAARYGCQVLEERGLPLLAHGFTHYSLSIHPVVYRVRRTGQALHEAGGRWMTLDGALAASIPKPVRTLLGQLQNLY